MIEYVSITSDIIERTSSTARVQQIVQLSLAPVFMLAAIGAFLNVLNARLFWLVDKIERIERAVERGSGGKRAQELPALEQRRVYAQRAVMLSTASAFTISVVIMLLFISAFVRTPLGTLVAVSWLVTMALLMAGLASFLLETRTAARRNHERMMQRKRRG